MTVYVRKSMDGECTSSGMRSGSYLRLYVVHGSTTPSHHCRVQQPPPPSAAALPGGVKCVSTSL
eukprot:CAMPEP_0174727256 /NCGR_PEP_ID=MMETSP1094-20130205/49403_1 /TAXON_ID=156173 /ORGANISM="Chrysochromulina brevifilum, Strain UTEX LB 985" /LENGTH=63 /DNA_ID=CAMNT_0015928949 /DNA_START=312 /DNA_END=503 /DNA_ORIENTATION=+